MVIPAVQRISPELSRSGKSIRRAARHRHRRQRLVQLEKFRVCPGIRAVKRHINRNIPDNFYFLLIRVGFQRKPLLRKQVLLELVKSHFLRIFFGIALQCLLLAEPDILIPLSPALAAEGILHRHIEGVILQPVSVLFHKLLICLVLLDLAVLKRFL